MTDSATPSTGAGSWRPLDTAPHDETILVFSKRWGPIIVEFSSEFREWLSRMQAPASLNGQEDDLTHWMPLPATPDGLARQDPASLRGDALA